MTSRSWSWCAIGLAAVVSACTVSTVDPVPVVVVPVTSTLVVDWTIEGRADPTDCRLSGATAVQIRIVSSSGFDAGTYEQACEVFATSIVLDAGTYSATALLVDGARRARSTTVVIEPFSLFGNDELRVPIDFPATSFF